MLTMLKTTSPETTVSSRVICAVADASDVSPTDLPPLYDVIDPDALDSLVYSVLPGGSIEFDYADTAVTVAVRDDGVSIRTN